MLAWLHEEITLADQFVRFKAVSLSALGTGRLARHTRGQIRSEHTREGPRAGTPPVQLVDEPGALEAALGAIDRDTRARGGQKGRRPAGCYDALFTGPNRYDGQNGEPLSYEDELKWAAACIVWLRESLPPGCIIANATLHRDEGSPHVHATIVPWCDETQSIDWRTVRARMAKMEPRAKLSFDGLLGRTKENGEEKTKEELDRDKGQVARLRANDKRAASKEMGAIIDDFYASVSSRFGIGRGDKGSGRRYRAVDRRIAAELDAKGAKAEAERARKREAAAVATADQAVKRAGEREAAATAAAADAVERRRTVEHEMSTIERKRTEAKNAATLEAEAERREELDRQERARVKLARIEDAIAVATAANGEKAQRGEEILEAQSRRVAAAENQVQQVAQENAELVKEVGRLQTKNEELAGQVTRRGARIDDLERERPALWRRAYRLGRRRGEFLALARVARHRTYEWLRRDGLGLDRLGDRTRTVLRVMREHLATVADRRRNEREERQAGIRKRHWEQHWERQASAGRGQGGLGC